MVFFIACLIMFNLQLKRMQQRAWDQDGSGLSSIRMPRLMMKKLKVKPFIHMDFSKIFQ